MTLFRFSLALAALLTAGCDRTAGEETGNVAAPVGTSASELPMTAAPANMVAEAPEPTPDRPSRHPLAGTDAPTADYRTCMETGDAGNGVTSGMRECLGAELKRQDERLNASYQTALAPLSQDDQSTLRSRQRTWLAERDAGCQQKAEPNKGGTLYPIVYGQCLLDATIERAGWLETYSPGKK